MLDERSKSLVTSGRQRWSCVADAGRVRVRVQDCSPSPPGYQNCTQKQALMGDFKFSVNSSVGSVSSVEFPASSTNSSSLFFTTPTSVPDTISSHQHTAMQDELLIEKSAVKSQQQLSPNSDVNGDQTVKAKEDDSSSGNIGSGVQTDKPNEQGQIGPAVTTPLQLGTGFNVSEPSLNVINSSNTSTASLWSSGPMEEGLLHSLNVPAVNGTLAFQNFPPTNPNPLYNTSLGAQIAGLPQSQGQPPQRRAITATHNFPHNLSRHIQQQSPQNMFMPNKGYTSWSSTQQNTWSPGPQNQANMQGLSPWNRGRSVPNLNPLQTMGNMGNMGNIGNRKPSPTFNHQHSAMVISPVKFRRSTSYPGKGLFPQPPTFEITNMDENREVLLPYPVCLFHHSCVIEMPLSRSMMQLIYWQCFGRGEISFKFNIFLNNGFQTNSEVKK